MGASHSTSHSYVLSTPKGNLKGIEQRHRSSGKPILRRYTRIPFAQAPIQNLRWRRPQPLPSDFSFSESESGEPGDYTSFGPTCPQPIYGHGAAELSNPNAAPPIENVQSEDCLYLNIWVPAGAAPQEGWPVQFHIHGGWLQIGDANQSNDHDPFDLFNSTEPRIIVAPTYRLNLFGFLAGRDLAEAEPSDPAPGNYGLWDQRCALEWVYNNISLFGGNPSNITVGGLSAGAHSAFLQLYYDTHLPPEQRIIKQVYLWSNALAIQPNSSKSDILTSQFDSLCEAVGVSLKQSAKAKLQALRQVSSEDLVSAIGRLKMHTFRSSTDDSFIPSTFLSSLHDGSFTTLLATSPQKPRIMLGEVCDEYLLYKLVNPPSNHTDLVAQLGNYYPQPVVERLLSLNHLYDIPDSSKSESKADAESYADCFAKMVADLQVHASIRGLTHTLLSPPPGRPVKTGKWGMSILPLPADRVLRYRISWRASSLDEWIAKEVGVCHAADTPIWWGSGWRAGYTESDKAKARDFLKPFGDFIAGKDVGDLWYGSDEQTGEDRVRVMDKHGIVNGNVKDDLWERGIEIWEQVRDAQKPAVKL